MHFFSADIKENDILALSPELMRTLLIDRTQTTPEKTVNIFWATDNYADRGRGYRYFDQITVDAITGENGNVIVPRALKSRLQQKKRSREMAEVFTPSWVCNAQCNLIDNAKFKRDNVFNTEIYTPEGKHVWITTPGRIEFPDGMTWIDYVKDNCMEITCGEAPYLASRYDTVSGEPIAVENRIGLLDRKLRIVGENTTTPEDWIEYAIAAYKSTYGYEWQGDNIVLARESLLVSFVDYYRHKFGGDPPLDSLYRIAEIVSWNIWQMDGLKFVLPKSCHPVPVPVSRSVFDDEAAEQKYTECPGCKKKNYHEHNGIKARIMDWEAGHPIDFVSLVHTKV